MSRRPLGTSEVGFICAAGTLWFMFGIDMQHDLCNFSPVGVLCICVQKAHIGDRVFLVVILTLRTVSSRALF